MLTEADERQFKWQKPNKQSTQQQVNWPFKLPQVKGKCKGETQFITEGSRLPGEWKGEINLTPENQKPENQ